VGDGFIARHPDLTGQLTARLCFECNCHMFVVRGSWFVVRGSFTKRHLKLTSKFLFFIYQFFLLRVLRAFVVNLNSLLHTKLVARFFGSREYLQ
jgi:hypothetical protein